MRQIYMTNFSMSNYSNKFLFMRINLIAVFWSRFAFMSQTRWCMYS